jgi:hypothetical protein
MMDIALNIQIGIFISQGNGIIQNYQSELAQLAAPTVAVAKDLLSEGAGEFIAELLGTKKAKKYGRKATQAYFAKNINESRQTITTKYYNFLNRWENDVVNLLQQVSTSGMVAPGNSQKLILRVRKADRYHRLETRVRHIVTELHSMQSEGLTYNSNLLPAFPKIIPSADPSKCLKDLECELRKFIEHELNKTNNDWWQQRVPLAIRNNAESKKNRRENMWPWYPPTSMNPVDYLDFSDYRKIILEPSNWRDIFIKYFKSESFIDSRLGELDPIRNDIAHSRSLSTIAIDKLRIYSQELLECMK